MFGISETQYMRWESGEARCMIDIEVGQLSEIEKCVILRRRHRLTQDVVAERMGIHPIGVKRMEAGLIRPNDLIEFWRKTTSE